MPSYKACVPHAIERHNFLFTHQQISEVLGITRTRVHQIEMRSLQKLRRALLEDREFCEVAQELYGVQTGEP